ncbi:MarR family winged helix-turn-helix transcriptional regulator [Quadrisphaera granulorum]|uniref:MarR family winged helix-turn-helix transcriptional regulator n=1 Tax=Quadrisphaera granulorum TaxID=317664 RepID=UPI0014757F88|nr:MarR family transcriptional regulator [Quadrisphaera granulorum]
MPRRPSNLLGAFAVAVDDAVRDALTRTLHLDHTAAAALLVVRERPGRPIGDLAASLDLTHSGAVRTVNRLADKDLLERGAGPDGRSRGLTLTPAGREATERALEARGQLLDELLGTLSASQQEAFVAGLEVLLARMPHTQQEAWRICRTCEHDACRGVDCPVGSAIRARLAGTSAPAAVSDGPPAPCAGCS